jgi:hypothetical protein
LFSNSSTSRLSRSGLCLIWRRKSRPRGRPPLDPHWLKRQARKQKTTVSALMGEAVLDLRRRRALDRLLGDVEITEEQVAEIHAEWRAD